MALRIETVYYDIEARTDKLSNGLGAAERRLSKFAEVIKAHPMAALGALASTAAMVAYQIAKMGAAFDSSVRQATAGLPQMRAQFDAVKQGLIDLSVRIPLPIEQLVQGFREVGEVGGREMQAPAEALKRLEIAARAAYATGIDLSTAIKTTDDLLDAFGLAGNEAAEAALKTAFAVSAGRANFGEFLGVLSTVAPFAHSAGLGMAEVAAAIGTLYDRGFSAMAITRMLRQAFGDTTIGFDNLRSAADRAGVPIDVVNGQLRVGADVAPVYAQAMQDAATRVDELGKAFEHVRQGPGARWAVFMSDLRALALRFGDGLAESFTLSDTEQRILHAIISGPGTLAREAAAAAPGPKPTFTGPFVLPEITVTAKPMTDAERRQIADRQRQALDQLQQALDRLTSSTLDEASHQIDALVRILREARLPAEDFAKAMEGIARLRSNTEDLRLFEAWNKATDEQGKLVDGLIAKEAMKSAEWERQKAILADMTIDAHRNAQSFQEGTEARRQAEEIEKRLLALSDRMAQAEKDRAAAKRDAKEQTKETLKHTEDLARQIEASARGALQLAQAFGLVDSETAAALENVAQIGAGIADIAAGNYASGILSVSGGLASLIGGAFKENPERAKEREVMKENTRAIEKLAATLGEFGLDVTGKQFTSEQAVAQEAARRASAFANQNGSRRGNVAGYGAPEDWWLRGLGGFNQVLAESGMTLAQFTETARALGISFAHDLPTMQELQAVAEAMAKAEITQFAHTFQGQLEALRAEFEIFDITDPIEQLKRLRELVSNQEWGSPALEAALAGLDLTTAEGRAAAKAAIQALFGQLQAGTLAPGQLGGMTPQDFLSMLEQLMQTLDQANQAAGTGTPQWGVNRSITEVTGDRLAAYLSTVAYWDEQTAKNTAAILDAMIRPAQVQPPTIAEMDSYMRAVTGVRIGEINVTVTMPGGASTPAAVGDAVGEAVVAALDRKLGNRQRARARALGSVVLS